MAVFRVEKTKDFTVMSNHHLRNVSLSLKAKGLLSLMLSLPDNWDYTTKGLAHICKDGVDSISSAIKELEKQGYLTRQRLRDAHGRLGDIEYVIHEKPVLPDEQDAILPPKRENPRQVNPRQVNSANARTATMKWGCSPGFCSAPTAAMCCISSGIRTKTANRTATSAAATRSAPATVRRTLSAPIC